MSHASSSNPSDSRATFGELIPLATWLRLGVSWSIVAAFMVWGHGWLADPIPNSVAIIAFLVLFCTILYASFGVVAEADHLAHELGEPYGTLILTLAIVSIEVILIAAVMLGPGETATIARDSIFAVMMIIMNLVMGICILAGGQKYGEQEYNAQGALSYLSMIVLLTGTALVLPNLVSTGDGTFRPGQAVAVAAMTVALYATFLLMQMRGYRRFFIQPEPGRLHVPLQQLTHAAPTKASAEDKNIDSRAMMVRSIILLGLILPIVLLAHDMAILIDHGIKIVGAPIAVSGVLIAIIVFTPESITAVKAAMNNEMQRSINLCLGAFVSTVGLTVPAVVAIAMLTGKTLVLGISPIETLLLALTIAVSALSFRGQRTSMVQGLIHIMLFALFSILLFLP